MSAERPAATTPSVGQVWADNDWRSAGRKLLIVKIEGDYAICSVVWPHHKTRKRTKVALRRFRPNSTGYRLVSDLPKAVGIDA